MTDTAVDTREADGFFLNVPSKLDDRLPIFRVREHRPVFFYAPLNQWFVFRYDDVVALFHDRRLSADRMKGFVDAAPVAVRGELAVVAPFLETCS